MLAHAIGDKVEISFEVQGVAMSLAGLGLTGMGEALSEIKRVGFPQSPSPPFSISPAGEAQVAIQLAGGVKAEWNRLGVDIHVRFWDALLDRYLGAARQALGTEDFEREWNKGRELLFEDAVQLALEIEAG